MVEFSGAAKELETLVIKIVADATQLKAGYSTVSKASDEVSDDLKDVQKASGKTSDAFDETGKAAKGSAKDLEVMADSTDETANSADSATKDVDDLTKSLQKEGDAAQKAGKETEQAGTDAEDAGDKMGKGAKSSDVFTSSLMSLKVWALAAAAAVAAISAAAVIASDRVKEAMNTIKLGTGNTGADLTGVIDEFNKIAGTVPNTMEEISTAVADLNTAYGLQGDDLDGLARHYLALADITKGDVSGQIERARAVFNKFGVTVEEQADTLDYFYRTAQLSGVKFDALLDMLDAGDDGFQMMGLSAKQAAALVGTMIKKDGVEAANELTAGLELGLNQVSNQMLAASSEAAGALEEASKAYEDAIKSKNPEKISEAAFALTKAKEEYEKVAKTTDSDAGVAKLQNVMKQMAGAKDIYEAQRIGADTFGKSALRVAGAVQNGALAWQGFDAEVSASTKSIQDWETETRTTGDAFAMLGTKATIAFAPLGDSIGNVITEKILPALDELGPYFEGVMPAAIHIVEMFGEGFETSVRRIKPILDALKPVLDAFFGSISSGSSSSVLQLNPLTHAMEIFGTWWDENSDTIIAGCAVIWEKIQELWTQIEPYVTTAMDVLNTIIDTALGTILDIITLVFALIAGDNEKAAELILGINLRLMKSLGMIIENGMNAVLEFIETSLKALLRFVADIAKGIVSIFQNAINSAIDAVNSLIEMWNEFVGKTGFGPTIELFKRVNITDDIENIASGIIDSVALPRVTIISEKIDALEKQYEKLLADQDTGNTVTTATDNSVTNNKITINQNITTNAPAEAWEEIPRKSLGGGGRG